MLIDYNILNMYFAVHALREPCRWDLICHAYAYHLLFGIQVSEMHRIQ